MLYKVSATCICYRSACGLERHPQSLGDGLQRLPAQEHAPVPVPQVNISCQWHDSIITRFKIMKYAVWCGKFVDTRVLLSEPLDKVSPYRVIHCTCTCTFVTISSCLLDDIDCKVVFYGPGCRNNMSWVGLGTSSRDHLSNTDVSCLQQHTIAVWPCNPVKSALTCAAFVFSSRTISIGQFILRCALDANHKLSITSCFDHNVATCMHRGMRAGKNYVCGHRTCTGGMYM